MEFTSTEIIAIIVALGAVIVNIIAALRMGGKVESIAQVTAHSLVETTKLQGQVKEVHTLANSNLVEVKNDLKQANTELAAIREVVADLKGERDKAATAAAFHTPIATVAPTIPNLGNRRVTDPPISVRVSTEDGPVPVDVQDTKTPPSKPNRSKER